VKSSAHSSNRKYISQSSTLLARSPTQTKHRNFRVVQAYFEIQSFARGMGFAPPPDTTTQSFSHHECRAMVHTELALQSPQNNKQNKNFLQAYLLSVT
jgi:hypothetical protein